MAYEHPVRPGEGVITWALRIGLVTTSEAESMEWRCGNIPRERLEVLTLAWRLNGGSDDPPPEMP